MTNFEYIKKRICDKLTVDDLMADHGNNVIGIMFCEEIEKVRGKECPMLAENCNSEKGCYKWLQQEYKEPILDSVEKEYLSAVIKPFKNRVKYITKKGDSSEEYINIELKNEEYIFFPCFKKGTMYKGMKSYKEYTLKDLGLE